MSDEVIRRAAQLVRASESAMDAFVSSLPDDAQQQLVLKLRRKGYHHAAWQVSIRIGGASGVYMGEVRQVWLHEPSIKEVRDAFLDRSQLDVQLSLRTVEAIDERRYRVEQIEVIE